MKLSRSNFIHFLRWISALLVVFNHLRSILFVDYNLVDQKGPLLTVFYLITGFGHQAVVIFFVLSGYLVAGSVIKQIEKNNFNIRLYFVNRFSRLYAVLFIALLLTLLLDKTGIHFDHAGLYTGKVKTATLGFSIADRLSANYFFASLFMLQTIVLPPLGSNSPLWSLTYEFWYYVLFPCFCLLFLYRKKRSELIVPILVLIAVFTFLPAVILLYFIIWLIGLIPFYLTIKQPFCKYILLVAFVFWLILKKILQMEGFYYDLILAMIVAIWLSSVSNFDQPSTNNLLKINERLSSFSYSTYLLHFPIIMLGLTLIHNYSNVGIWNQPGFTGYCIFIGISIVVIICSYIVASFTEFKTPELRDYIKHLIFTKRTKND